MSKIYFKVINICSDCPHWRGTRDNTEWFDWMCLREQKLIPQFSRDLSAETLDKRLRPGSVETRDKRPPIPDWCPLNDLDLHSALPETETRPNLETSFYLTETNMCVTSVQYPNPNLREDGFIGF